MTTQLQGGLSAQTWWQVVFCYAQASRSSTAVMAPLCLLEPLSHGFLPQGWLHQWCGWVPTACHLSCEGLHATPQPTPGATSTGPRKATAAPAGRHLRLSLVTCPSRVFFLSFGLHLGGVNLFIRTGPTRQPTPTEANMKPSVWLLPPSDCISGSSAMRTCRGEGIISQDFTDACSRSPIAASQK